MSSEELLESVGDQSSQEFYVPMPEGYRKGRITLNRLVELVSTAPARFFGIEERKGRIAAGFDADMSVIDEDGSWTVRAAEMHNLNRYTPFEGRTLAGRVTATFVRGTEVFSRSADGTESFGPAGFGQRVKRETRMSE